MDKEEKITPKVGGVLDSLIKDNQDKKKESDALKEPQSDDKAPKAEPKAEEKKTEEKKTDTTVDELVARLTREKDALTANLSKLQSELDTKKSLYDSLLTDKNKLQAEMIKEVARQLAITRINLAKPGSAGLDTKEKFDVYVDELCERSLDSLRDSITDLLPELAGVMRKGGEHNLYKETKVDNPAKGNEDKTNVKNEDKDDEPKIMSKKDYLKD